MKKNTTVIYSKYYSVFEPCMVNCIILYILLYLQHLMNAAAYCNSIDYSELMNCINTVVYFSFYLTNCSVL